MRFCYVALLLAAAVNAAPITISADLTDTGQRPLTLEQTFSQQFTINIPGSGKAWMYVGGLLNATLDTNEDFTANAVLTITNGSSTKTIDTAYFGPGITCAFLFCGPLSITLGQQNTISVSGDVRTAFGSPRSYQPRELFADIAFDPSTVWYTIAGDTTYHEYAASLTAVGVPQFTTTFDPGPQVTAAPEPAPGLLAGIGLAALLLLGGRFKGPRS